MGKLTPDQIVNYFDVHVPYRLGIFLIHYRMTRPNAWSGSNDMLNACFVASLVTTRMFLNTLGIGKKDGKLVQFDPQPTDVCVDDLGGELVDITKIPSADHDLIMGFLKMADQAAAHFTIPIDHKWERTHDVVLLVHQYLKVHLYERTGRAIVNVLG